MVENNATSYLVASICIAIISGMIVFLGFGYELKTWIKIIYFLLFLVILYPVIKKIDEINKKIKKTMPEIFLKIEGVLCEISCFFLCSALFYNPDKVDLGPNISLTRFAEYSPIMMGGFYALYLVGMAFIALTKGRNYKALVVFAMVALFSLWIILVKISMGTMSLRPWGAVGLLLLIPGCLRMKTIETFGHI